MSSLDKRQSMGVLFALLQRRVSLWLAMFPHDERPQMALACVGAWLDAGGSDESLVSALSECEQAALAAEEVATEREDVGGAAYLEVDEALREVERAAAATRAANESVDLSELGAAAERVAAAQKRLERAKAAEVRCVHQVEEVLAASRFAQAIAQIEAPDVAFPAIVDAVRSHALARGLDADAAVRGVEGELVSAIEALTR